MAANPSRAWSPVQDAALSMQLFHQAVHPEIGLAFSQHEQCDLRHRRQVAWSTDRSFWHTYGVTPLLSISTSVSVISRRLPELPCEWTLILPSMAPLTVSTDAGHRCRQMIIDKVTLEVLYLIIVKDYLWELADTVFTPYIISWAAIFFSSIARHSLSFCGRRVKLHFLPVTGNVHHIIYCEVWSCYHQFFSFIWVWNCLEQL